MEEEPKVENKPQVSGNSVEIARNPDGTFAEGHIKIGGSIKGSKKVKFLDEIEEMLDEMAEGKDYTYRVVLKKQVLKKLLIDGDTSLIKEYWQQRDGKPEAKLKVSGELNNPFNELTAEQKLIYTRQLIEERIGNTGEDQPDRIDGANTELPEDGESASGGGKLLEKEPETQSDIITEKPLENNTDNNKLDNTAVNQ